MAYSDLPFPALVNGKITFTVDGNAPVTESVRLKATGTAPAGLSASVAVAALSGPTKVGLFSNSLGAGVGSTAPATDNPLTQLAGLAGTTNYSSFVNYSIPGAPLGTGYQEQPGVSIINLLNTHIAEFPAGSVILLSTDLTNDVRLGGVFSRVTADMAAAVAIVLNAGCFAVVSTHSGFFSGTINNGLILADEWIRANWRAVGARGLVDIAHDGSIGAGAGMAKNPYYSVADYPHLSTSGYGVYAGLLLPALAPVRLGGTYGVVTPYPAAGTGPPADFPADGLIAPSAGPSIYYNATGPYVHNLPDVGNHFGNENTDPAFWPHPPGLYTTMAGETSQSRELWTRYVQIDNMPTFGGSTTTRVELIPHDGSPSIVISVDESGAAGRGSIPVLDLGRVGWCVLKMTAVGGPAAWNGYRISRDVF